MRWVFHAGPNKTGTTSTQVVLDSNREGLAERGVVYPEAGIVNSAHHMYNFALSMEHNGAAPYAEALGITEIPTLDELIQSAEREATEVACETIIASSETMWTWGPRRIERLRSALPSGDSALVCVVARPHLERELSMWQEEVKHGYTAPPAEYLSMHADTATSSTGCVLTERLSMWNDAGFRVRVVPLPTDRQSAIWNSILHAVGHPWLGNEVSSEVLNPSLDYVAAESLRRTIDELARLEVVSINPMKKAEPLDRAFKARHRVIELLDDVQRPTFPAHVSLLMDPDFDQCESEEATLYARDLAQIVSFDPDLDMMACLDSLKPLSWVGTGDRVRGFREQRTRLDQLVEATSDAATAHLMEVFAERSAVEGSGDWHEKPL